MIQGLIRAGSTPSKAGPTGRTSGGRTRRFTTHGPPVRSTNRGGPCLSTYLREILGLLCIKTPDCASSRSFTRWLDHSATSRRCGLGRALSGERPLEKLCREVLDLIDRSVDVITDVEINAQLEELLESNRRRRA